MLKTIYFLFFVIYKIWLSEFLKISETTEADKGVSFG